MKRRVSKGKVEYDGKTSLLGKIWARKSNTKYQKNTPKYQIPVPRGNQRKSRARMNQSAGDTSSLSGPGTLAGNISHIGHSVRSRIGHTNPQQYYQREHTYQMPN